MFQGMCPFKEDTADSLCSSLHPLFNRCVVVDFLFLSKILWPWAQWGSILQFKWKLRLPRFSSCGQHRNLKDRKSLPWLMLKMKHPNTRRCRSPRRVFFLLLLSDKCAESVTKVAQVDRNFGGQHWNVKVCVSQIQFQSFWLHLLSTFEELLHMNRLISTHTKTGKNSVLGCKRGKKRFFKGGILFFEYSCDTSWKLNNPPYNVMGEGRGKKGFKRFQVRSDKHLNIRNLGFSSARTQPVGSVYAWCQIWLFSLFQNKHASILLY